MNLQVAIFTIWMPCGVALVKLGTAPPKPPHRVATHFGLSLLLDRKRSEGGLAAILVIAVLGQAAPATFVLLRVAQRRRPIGLLSPNNRYR